MKKKLRVLLIVGFVSIFVLSGCTAIKNMFVDFEQDFRGLSVEIKSYNEQAQLIDKVSGESVKVSRNKEFDSSDSDGSSKKDSKVLDITVGKGQMTHVGSSLIIQDKRLTDYFTEFETSVDLDNIENSVPLINNMVNSFKNEFAPKSKLILIRSQQGYPLATYVGDTVSISSSEVPSSTNFLIDGHRLFVYRCDYTVYDMDLLR